MRTYLEILRDISRSCNNVFLEGNAGIHADIVKAATEIYIVELQTEQLNKPF